MALEFFKSFSSFPLPTDKIPTGKVENMTKTKLKITDNFSGLNLSEEQMAVE